ncbi:hypothetical protein KCP77_14485 [Salmonella enterica subsp. enterica]|nr:hypothetical protein KCP77_14485 [Salmonella enterica subsp. enterica]
MPDAFYAGAIKAKPQTSDFKLPGAPFTSPANTAVFTSQSVLAHGV